MVDVALPSSIEEEGQEEDLNNNRVPLSYILSNHRQLKKIMATIY
jgi:hypothetical protein